MTFLRLLRQTGDWLVKVMKARTEDDIAPIAFRC
jgi:hypothetical protein